MNNQLFQIIGSVLALVSVVLLAIRLGVYIGEKISQSTNIEKKSETPDLETELEEKRKIKFIIIRMISLL